jgi:hypothetical protein
MKDIDENGVDIAAKPVTKKKDLAEVAKMLEDEEKVEKKPAKKAEKKEETEE